MTLKNVQLLPLFTLFYYLAPAQPSNGQFQQHGPAPAAATTTSANVNISATIPKSEQNYLETSRQVTGILNKFMSLGYDKRVRPNYGGPPVEVNVTMRILSISSVSEVMMDFTADFYFRQTWHDPRLAFKKLGEVSKLVVGAEVSDKIWLPDTFFGNEKMAYFHEATTPNVFLRIDHSGEVYRSIRDHFRSTQITPRLTVTSSCPMNLQYFPMDRQRCTIEAESYGYNVKDIIYRWARKDTAVERDTQISLPQFDIGKTVQKYRLEELSSGTYSRLIAEIHFARRMGYYLIQIYIPSSLIVVISWVSFWLHRNASPARVQLGVTTVLTMTTLMSSTNAALPKISYVKSIDIFLGTCFIMVFAALLEYATVGYLGKRIAMRKAHAQHAQTQAQARVFAQLQAQGAQGDPVPPVVTSSLLAESMATSQQPATATFNENQSVQQQQQQQDHHLHEQQAAMLHHLASMHHQACNANNHERDELPPQVPLRGHNHNYPHSSCHLLGRHQPCCCHHCNRTVTSSELAGYSGTTFNQMLESSDRQVVKGCRPCSYHTSSSASRTLPSSQPRKLTFTNNAFDSDSNNNNKSSTTRTCPHNNHRQPLATAPVQAPEPPSYCARSSGSKAAAAAAAATFINMHRKNRGLPPSNFSHGWPTGSGLSGSGSLETIFGIRPSDIDKYSRVVFPVCFVCFQLMYWIVYLHISAFLEIEQQQQQQQQQ